MRAPKFWTRQGVLCALLSPLAGFTEGAARRRAARARPARVSVPVISVGNLVAGGAGKTPVAMAIGRYLVSRGASPHFLTRGYKGKLKGPVRVDLKHHTAEEVGDEALLLAEFAPTWVCRDRAAGAEAAVAGGADVLILDDAHQNFTLAKDLSVLVIDGGYGFGNGQVMPSGPLREPIIEGLERADYVIVLGEDVTGAEDRVANRLPILHGRYIPVFGSDELAGRDVYAFAGIGRPEKFFDTLKGMGCNLVGRRGFPDHCRYTANQVMKMVNKAAARGAVPVTTAKDAARLPPETRAYVEVLDIVIEWREPDILMTMLDGIEAGGALAANG